MSLTTDVVARTWAVRVLEGMGGGEGSKKEWVVRKRTYMTGIQHDDVSSYAQTALMMHAFAQFWCHFSLIHSMFAVRDERTGHV